MKMHLPPELAVVRKKALRAIQPLKPMDFSMEGGLFLGRRTKASRDLPPYHLVYFLLVDLLGFKNAGQFEKTAWSVPVDWHGRGFIIEHRKMGIGVFVRDPERDEAAASQIVIRLQKAVRVAQPFFEWLAQDAVSRSAVNVHNNASSLFERYIFLCDLYREKRIEFERRKNERVVTTGKTPDGGTWTQSTFPAFKLIAEGNWLALSAVEAFFAWTEHVLIHLAVLMGKKTTADEIAEMAEADWSVKFKAALDSTDQATKTCYDRLIALRKELRNYVAHGAFGKQGEAFSFHSGAGAVPVLLPHKAGTRKFKFGHGLSFDADAAINAMDAFVEFLWSGARAPAKVYLQDNKLPLILTYVQDGTYSRAMRSVEDMENFTRYLNGEMDRSANMDW